ncbi:BPTI/Kunitz domain-containing protein 1-like [Rhynchophorus ferrugineus]|uniref:BPTI/Kunitz domain-containing protein 1-like n=1 Tax=Rhynchophorus ferrugineus TaxID=354439 RepID=UPI003FCEBD75
MIKINFILLIVCAASVVRAVPSTTQFSASDCTQPHTQPDATCRGMIPRYYWNDAEKQCQDFFWGGCRATNNNFATLKECQAVAGSICA